MSETAQIGPETIRLQPRAGWHSLFAPSELWRYRDVALQIAARDVKVRYRQTILGAAWAVLQPVGLVVVFSIFFGHVAKISSEGLPYWLFSLGGLVPWSFFAASLLLGSESMISNSALVSKIYFPRIFIPGGVVIAGLVDLAIGAVILVVAAASDGYTPTLALLALPLLTLIELAAALGVVSALSAVNVRYRDVRYVVPFAVQLWLFITPIAYPSTLLHSPWRTLSALNPMTGVVEGYRWALFQHGAPPWTLMGVSAASALVLLVGGLAYFASVERGFADLV